MVVPDTERNLETLTAEYEAALESYLSGAGEEALLRAYELGRAAMIDGFGVLDIVELHYQTIKDRVLQNPENMPTRMRDATIFLEESLSPYEITHRAYRDTIDLLGHITRFAYVASHEVKSPLTSIMSSAGMLMERLQAELSASEARLLANVLTGVTILKARADDMMDMAALYAGALSIRPRLVDITGLMRRVHEHLEPEVRWRGMELNLKLGRNIPRTQLDPERIEQVITNLVQNAAKYATEGGVIDLGTTARDGVLIIEVRDYGRGTVAAKHIKRVFTEEPLNRDAQAHGTGLGLLLCKQLVEAHHGEIAVSSLQGEGNIIQLRLPLRAAQADIGGVFESPHR